MSESNLQARGFSQESFSWQSYDAYRPQYPPSLWSLVFSYHEQHHNHYDSAVDLGCGSGAASHALVQRFSSVTVADPSQHNLNSARQNLRGDDCRLHFICAPAETPAVRPSSQNMVTMFEAIQWTDVPAAMDQIAIALKPGGTLALAYYSPRVMIADNQRAQSLWNAIWVDHCEQMFSTPADPKLAAANHAHRRAIENINMGLDYVPLNHTLWAEGARRVYINCEEGRRSAIQICEAENIHQSEDRVRRDREKVEWMDNVPGWQREVDLEWFRKYYWETCQVANALGEGHKTHSKSLWTAFEVALQDGRGKIRIHWPATVLLATRK